MPAAPDPYWFGPENRVLLEECGIFGIYGPGEDVARQTFFGLYTLQHRGQESAGIAVADGEGIAMHRQMGLVAQVFDDRDLDALEGFAAIGHTRYSTTGSSRIENAQPVFAEADLGPIAMGHNGNLVNSLELRDELLEISPTFHSTTDSELILSLVVNAPGETWIDRIRHTFPRLRGSFSLVFLTPTSVIGVRDGLGNRPLCLGTYGDTWLIASESCSFEALDARFERDFLAGEIIEINDTGVRSYGEDAHPPTALCIFEYIYFARPDSVIEGASLYEARVRMGARLAREYPVDADLVIGVPDSATAAAIGYAKEAGIPYGEGLVKSRYIGRTFIQPDDRIRRLGVKLKLNTLPTVTAGKSIVVIDDSIVRGNTTKAIVSLLRTSGNAAEVHLRISSPPIKWPCFYGIDIQHADELIANNMTVPQICKHVDADSLSYLSIEGLIRATGIAKDKLCTGCLTREYPIPVQLEMDKMKFETADDGAAMAASDGDGQDVDGAMTDGAAQAPPRPASTRIG